VKFKNIYLFGVLFSGLFTVLSSGCGLWDDKMVEPHTIIVPSFNLTTYEDEGTDSNNIAEVWVYSETDVLGVFPLPATIPVLQENGEDVVHITLLPGVRVNGISSTRKPYPFYEVLELDVNYVPGGVDTVEFHSNYVSGVEVVLAENFESANRFQASSTSTAEVVRTFDPAWVFEGAVSGLIMLSEDAAHVTSTTQEQLYDLTGDVATFLEFNYRCDNSFAVGLEAIGGINPERTPIIVLNPTGEEWHKMYLDLGPFLRSTPTAYGYELTLDAILDMGEKSGYVVVDNFKIVHY
tara:strand:+ start:2320 stop:3201 length:882 start_codon:yes stop_codon:yes gene_type:complete